MAFDVPWAARRRAGSGSAAPDGGLREEEPAQVDARKWRRAQPSSVPVRKTDSRCTVASSARSAAGVPRRWGGKLHQKRSSVSNGWWPRERQNSLSNDGLLAEVTAVTWSSLIRRATGWETTSYFLCHSVRSQYAGTHRT
uniref:Uncharacterized protein n=1 Tax=Oryza barthii TaxID=65489 RepID=A0A0D3G3V2_9ORYZ